MSSKTLTVGVIIPVFNSGHKAINAIKSVLAQTNVAIQEVVVVDDGSSDGSAKLIRDACKDYDMPVKILSISNSGAANARNHGMRNCSCDLYAFLDSDDVWLSDKLQSQMALFSDTSVGMVGCLTTMGQRGAHCSINSKRFRVISLRQQLFKNYFQTSTVMVRRQVVEEVGHFPADQRHAEEGDFFNRIAARYKCILLSEVLVDYDGGKQGFGASGLSANLIAMEKGELRNLRHAYSRGDCGVGLLLVLISYSLTKFARRILITFLGRPRKNV